MRWQHPTRGLLPASAFITVAEETGLVVDMGRWVFAEACRQLAAWRREYPDLPLVVRVNMSPAQFVISGLVEFVENCLRVHRIPGERLCIEMTEHAVLQEPEQTARILRGFQALGVEVAIDDFGTGYASLTELKHLPVNLLKLDQTFVQGIDTDPSDRAIVEAIIQLGRALDLDVIAEGIECSATIDKLLELGCHRGQGYLMSVPMSPEELAPVLRAGRHSPLRVPYQWKGGPRTVGQVPVTLVDNVDARDIDLDQNGDGQLHEPWVFLTMLDQMSTSEINIGFIYSVLDLLGPALPAHRRRGRPPRRGPRHPGLPAGAQEPGRRLPGQRGHRPGRLLRARRRPRRRPRRRAQRVPARPDAAPGPPQRRPRPAHQHRQPTALRRRPAQRRGPERAVRLGLHPGAHRPQRVQGHQRPLGHAVGDDMLRSFGWALRRSVRSGDTTARMGGDEFAIILANAEGTEVLAFTERLRALLVSLPELDFSVGTATSPADSTDPAELYRIADARLYEKKGIVLR